MSKKKIAIIAAMPEELEVVLKETDLVKKEFHYNHEFYIVDYKSSELILTLCGVGKVNSALVTSILHFLYQVDLVINVGSALGLATDLAIGDVVLAHSARFHDLKLDYDDVVDTPKRFLENCNLSLVREFELVCRQLNLNFKTGMIVSGDQFISDLEVKKEIKNRFSDAIAIDMETCAILKVANQLSVDCVIVRGISDLFNSVDNVIDFNQFVKVAAASSWKIIKTWLDNIKKGDE